MMKLTCALVAVALGAGCSVHAQQEINVNLCLNPGFEQMAPAGEGDTTPMAWAASLGKGKVDFAIVDDEPHSDSAALTYTPSRPTPAATGPARASR